MKGMALFLGLSCLLVAAGVLVAQPGGAAKASSPPPAEDVSSASYQATWYTVDGGGSSVSVGASYVLGGTAGQPDAGTMSGGSYTLAGGFWYRVPVDFPLARIYLPLVLRHAP